MGGNRKGVRNSQYRRRDMARMRETGLRVRLGDVASCMESMSNPDFGMCDEVLQETLQLRNKKSNFSNYTDPGSCEAQT
jgi:hypothetical protein